MGIEHGSPFQTEPQIFNNVDWDSDAYYFCNESGFADLIPELVKRRSERPGGTGLVIGSGAIYSLLPELDLDILLMVDSNRMVIDFTKMSGEAIGGSKDPNEAIEKMFGRNPEFLPEILTKIKESDFETTLGIIEGTLFDEELFNLNNYHWSNNQRFELVKKTLERTKIYFIHSTIEDPRLGELLKNLLQSQSLSYANLSNVHGYLDRIDFISDLPIDERTTLQYSNHTDVEYEGYPRAKLASSFCQYLQDMKHETEMLNEVIIVG